jgi:hypothetical protein
MRRFLGNLAKQGAATVYEPPQPHELLFLDTYRVPIKES